MRVKLIIPILILGVSIAGCVQKPIPATNQTISWRTDITETLVAAKAQNKPIIVDFYADWCSWCRKMDKTTYSDPQVIKTLQDDFICVRIDVDKQPDVASTYGVRSLPTTIFLDSSGSEMGRVTGYRPPDDFVQILKNVIR